MEPCEEWRRFFLLVVGLYNFVDILASSLVREQLEPGKFLLINLIARARTHISKKATLHEKHLIATGEDEEGRSQCRGSSAFLLFSRLQVEEVAVKN